MLRSMLKGGTHDKEVQVNEIELNWGIPNISELGVIEKEFLMKNDINLETTGFNYNDQPAALSGLNFDNNKDMFLMKAMGKKGEHDGGLDNSGELVDSHDEIDDVRRSRKKSKNRKTIGGKSPNKGPETQRKASGQNNQADSPADLGTP